MHYDLIDVAYLTACACIIMTLHVLNDVVNDVEFDTKLDNYAMIASLKSEPTCKLSLAPGILDIKRRKPGILLARL